MATERHHGKPAQSALGPRGGRQAGCFSQFIRTSAALSLEPGALVLSLGLCPNVGLISTAPLGAHCLLPPTACNLDVILGFDGSRDQNVFVAQKGLESKVDAILNRISQMQRLSCSGGQMPVVRVSVVGNTPSGPVEAFDFAEYQPELLEKFRNMRSQHPYVLTADTLKAYQNKFRQASPDSVKVSRAFPWSPGGLWCSINTLRVPWPWECLWCESFTQPGVLRRAVSPWFYLSSLRKYPPVVLDKLNTTTHCFLSHWSNCRAAKNPGTPGHGARPRPSFLSWKQRGSKGGAPSQAPVMFLFSFSWSLTRLVFSGGHSFYGWGGWRSGCFTKGFGGTPTRR